MAALEKKYDIQFQAVFEAIRELMTRWNRRKKRPIALRRGKKND